MSPMKYFAEELGSDVSKLVFCCDLSQRDLLCILDLLSQKIELHSNVSNFRLDGVVVAFALGNDCGRVFVNCCR